MAEASPARGAGPAGRAASRVAVLLAAGALLAGPAAAATTVPGAGTADAPDAAGAAAGADVAVAGAGDDVHVEVTALRDDPLTPDDDLTVGLRVVNGTEEPATGLTAELRLQRERLGSRDAVAAWADAPPEAAAGEVLLTLPLVEPLAPGTGRDLVATVPADALGLPGRTSAWGPRGLAVDVVDDAGDRLDADRGLVVWQPADDAPLPAGAPVRVSVVVPLTGAAPDPATALVPVAAVEDLVDGDGPPGAGEGRLGRLLEVARHPAATWALDPLLLDSTSPDRADLGAAVLPVPGAGTPPPTEGPADGTTDEGGGTGDDDAPTAPTEGDAGAAGGDPGTDDEESTDDADEASDGTAGPGRGGLAWRERLLATAPDHELLALPRGDTDLLSVAAAARPGVWEEALVQSRTALAAAGLPVDGARVVDDVVWPAGGELGDRSAGLAAGAGARGVLLDAAAVPADDVVVPLGGDARGVAGLVADGPLSAALAAAGDDPVAGARLLAETAALAREAGTEGAPGHVLVVAPRGWDVDVAAGYSALDALTAAPWTTTAPVTTLLDDAAADGVAADLPPTADGTPGALLDAGALGRASDAVAEVVPLAGALGDAAAVEDARLRATAAAALAARREDGWTDAVLAVVDATLAAAQGVSLLQGGTVTVVGAEASVPVTVTNALDRPVDVVVAGRSGSPRLRVLDDVAAAVPAGARTQVLVPVEAVGEGDAVLTLQLVAPGGAVLGEPVSVPVRVRLEWAAWGTAGVAAAGGLVLVAGLVRSVRRARRRGRGEGPRAAEPPAAGPPAAARAGPADPPDHHDDDDDDAQDRAGRAGGAAGADHGTAPAPAPPGRAQEAP